MVEPVLVASAAVASAGSTTIATSTAAVAATAGTATAATSLALPVPPAVTVGLVETLHAVADPLIKRAVRVSVEYLTAELLRESPELRRLAALAFRLGAAEVPVAEAPLTLAAKAHVDLADWIEGKSLAARSVVQPLDLVERWREVRTRVVELTAHITTSDKQFQMRVDAARQRLAQAVGPGDLDTLDRYLEVSVAPLLAEKLVEYALRPFFERVTPQVRVAVGDSYSVVDLLCEGARKPIIVGWGLKIDVGQSLAVEIKARREDGLQRSLGELRSVQLPAHHARADHSMVVMTSDVGDIARGEQAALRGAVRAEGSRIVGGLPSKSVLVEVCERLVRRGDR